MAKRPSAQAVPTRKNANTPYRPDNKKRIKARMSYEKFEALSPKDKLKWLYDEIKRLQEDK